MHDRGVIEVPPEDSALTHDFPMDRVLAMLMLRFSEQGDGMDYGDERTLQQLSKKSFASLEEVLQYYGPKMDFEVDAEGQEALLAELVAAGVSAASQDGAFEGWSVRGAIERLEHFSAKALLENAASFDGNILHDLAELEAYYKGAGDAAAKVNLRKEGEREQFVAALTTLVELLRAQIGA